MQNWKFLDYRLPCRVDATSREYCNGWSCGSSKHRCLVISRRRGGYLWRTRCGRSKAMPMRCSSRSAATSMNCTQSPVPAVDSSGAVAQGQFVDRAVLGALGSIVLRDARLQQFRRPCAHGESPRPVRRPEGHRGSAHRNRGCQSDARSTLTADRVPPKMARCALQEEAVSTSNKVGNRHRAVLGGG